MVLWLFYWVRCNMILRELYPTVSLWYLATERCTSNNSLPYLCMNTPLSNSALALAVIPAHGIVASRATWGSKLSTSAIPTVFGSFWLRVRYSEDAISTSCGGPKQQMKPPDTSPLTLKHVDKPHGWFEMADFLVHVDTFIRRGCHGNASGFWCGGFSRLEWRIETLSTPLSLVDCSLRELLQW